MNYNNIGYKYQVHKLSGENFVSPKEAACGHKGCILVPARGGDK